MRTPSGANAWSHSQSRHQKEKLLSCEARGKTPPYSAWEPFDQAKAGDFYATDLGAVREWLFDHGHIPKVTLGHKGELTRKLTVYLPEGKCVIRHVDEDSCEQVSSFVEDHGLE